MPQSPIRISKVRLLKSAIIPQTLPHIIYKKYIENIKQRLFFHNKLCDSLVMELESVLIRLIIMSNSLNINQTILPLDLIKMHTRQQICLISINMKIPEALRPDTDFSGGKPLRGFILQLGLAFLHWKPTVHSIAYVHNACFRRVCLLWSGNIVRLQLPNKLTKCNRLQASK